MDPITELSESEPETVRKPQARTMWFGNFDSLAIFAAVVKGFRLDSFSDLDWTYFPVGFSEGWF